MFAVPGSQPLTVWLLFLEMYFLSSFWFYFSPGFPASLRGSEREILKMEGESSSYIIRENVRTGAHIFLECEDLPIVSDNLHLRIAGMRRSTSVRRPQRKGEGSKQTTGKHLSNRGVKYATQQPTPRYSSVQSPRDHQWMNEQRQTSGSTGSFLNV